MSHNHRTKQAGDLAMSYGFDKGTNMTSDKRTDKISKGVRQNKLAVALPSIMDHASLARGTAASMASREFIGSPAFALAKVMSESPLADMLAASQRGVLGAGTLDQNSLSGITESVRRITESMSWAHELGTLRWRDGLFNLDKATIGAIARQHGDLQTALAEISNSISATGRALQLAQPTLSIHALATIDSFGSLRLTGKRLAAFAAISDTYGFGALHRRTSEALLGSWHTDFNLPNRYWDDFAFRRELYRESEVDTGLIEADPETALEIAIASGAIVGEIIEQGRYIIGHTATGLLTLTTENLATDIYELVGVIESALRRLLSRKLSEVAGPKWFRQRVPGALVAKARETRERSLKAGEEWAPYIEFLTLGELMDVVLRADNWEEVFEPIFRNRDWFKRDIEVISVARNPNAHYRVNDSLRLTEAMIVWQRLSGYIENDGRWLREAEIDE